MRWLLLKDLQILRRSPLLSALLVLYPIVIAVLIGFALSAGPDKPRVAFLNEVPVGTPFTLGGEEFDIVGARSELCERIECVRVATEEEARERVVSGDVLGALIIPADLIDRLKSLGSLNPDIPAVRVLVNEEDPVKGSLVDDRISAMLGEANLRISQTVSEVATRYLQVILDGGGFGFVSEDYEILGLRNAEAILREVREELPPDSPKLEELDEVIRFARLASDNLDVADDLLGSVSQPIKVDKEVVAGAAPSLDNFAISVAATITLMFVTVLLVAGSLALEREENAFPRLTRGLISKGALLGEKILLGCLAALVVTLLMLLGISAFVPLDWGRVASWPLAIVAGGAAFAAFGVALGAAARDVRAASLLAFMVSLPLAFLSLVPSGTVSPAVYDGLEIVTALFPFDPAQRAISAALDSAAGSIWIAILHLALLAVAYGLLARVAVRRFS